MNIFARPYQTALSVLSLLKYSGRHIDRVYMQFEPRGSAYDAASPHGVGNNKLTRSLYRDSEDNARRILEKHFRKFVAWCRERKNGLFV